MSRAKYRTEIFSVYQLIEKENLLDSLPILKLTVVGLMESAALIFSNDFITFAFTKYITFELLYHFHSIK